MNDSAYVAMMKTHHADGIKMAQKAVDKASNVQVKQLASRIVSDQQKELQELEGLQAKVKDDGAAKEHAGMMKPMPMEHLDQMSGAQFDRMFLQMMTAHHREAVKMFKAAKLAVAGVQQFARRTTQVQQKEITEMTKLHKQLGV